jgi:ubiquinone/menaquinone biosynthesis C-methylase UbiE
MSALGPTSDYTPIASRYDHTRDIPGELLKTCYGRLIAMGILPRHGRILDAGCGTGQISLPLAALGYEVCGYDISRAMVEIANAKVDAAWQVSYGVADVRQLPDHDSSFDAVVVSKLFQHVGNWQSAVRELLRVLKPNAFLLHINEKGAFKNAVRLYFASCADAAGFTDRYIGLRDRTDLARYVLNLGCEQVPMKVEDLCWEKRITYDEALEQLQARLSSEFWGIPDDTYETILAETAQWIESQPSGRTSIETMRPHLVLEAFRKR